MRSYQLDADALDRLLRSRCMSMTEAAAQAGMSVKTLSSLVRRHRRASPITVRTLAKGLGVPPASLFPELADLETAAS